MLTIVSDPEHAIEALGDPALGLLVVVPAYNAPDETLACCLSIVRHTPPDVPMLIIDDASRDRRAIKALQTLGNTGELDHRRVVILAKSSNGGFVESANMAFSIAGRSDVVLVNSDVEVAAGWMEGLSRAAGSSSTVASVSTLTNHGTIVSVPTRNEPDSELPGGLSLEQVASRVREGSPRLYPRLPTAIGHCTYIRRLALDVVGQFDDAFSPGYGEEVDWSQRALAMGLEHIVADDVFVYHKGGVTFASVPAASAAKERHDALTASRYPYYLLEVRAVEEDITSPLAASLLAAKRSIRGLHVVVDGMCLGPFVTGTQVVVTQLSRALAAQPTVGQVEVFVPSSVPAYARELLQGVEKVSLTPTAVGVRSPRMADVAVRPYQFTSVSEVDWLRRSAERVVVLQLDLIAFNDPAYFDRYGEWERYRDVQRLALAATDGVGFISDTVRRQVDNAGLLSRDLASRVIYLGTDDGPMSAGEVRAPRGCEDLADGFLLQLGVAFHHKNRIWSLRVLRQLLESGWKGVLVLAGPEPSQGSSRPAESEWLRRHPEVGSHLITLGGVSEAEKAWLYEHSGLVLYPTVSEGFGLVPFEAAAFGKACLSTRQTSLDEVLPPEMVTLDGLDPRVGASVVERLLSDSDVRAAMIAAVRERGAQFTWDRTAASLADLLWEVTGRPSRAVVAVQTPRHHVALGLVSVDTPVRRALAWVAVALLRTGPIRDHLLKPGSSRGVIARRVYHRAMGDARGHRRR